MGNREKEPMLKLFMEESIQLITELSSIMEENREQNSYEYESIKEIFRIFHTIKADATMMLFENIAEPARSFERVLFYYRDQKKVVEDAEFFNKLLNEIIAFIQAELDKIEETGKSDGNSEKLVEKIEAFNHTLVKEEVVPEPEEERQFYYIAGTFDNTNSKSSAGTAGSYVIDKKTVHERKIKEKAIEQKPLKAREETNYNRQKHTLITDDDITALKNISSELEKVLKEYEDRFENVSIIALEEDNLQELKSYSRRIKRWLREIQAADFKGIALKMQNVVEEMTETLEKPVKLTITGIDTVIEKRKLEKISSAMIHLLRNSIDHGIESAEERKKLGKSETGQVSIVISKEEERVNIVISDDGVGLDKNEILKKAKEKEILSKPEEEYTEEEIYGLLMHHGFSTKNEVTNYSGLGVGLDVVNQNVTGMGGEIRISSQLHKGTSITIVI